MTLPMSKREFDSLITHHLIINGNMKHQIEIIGQIGNMESTSIDGKTEDRGVVRLETVPLSLEFNDDSGKIDPLRLAFYAAGTIRALFDAFSVLVPEAKDSFKENFKKYFDESLEKGEVKIYNKDEYEIIE